MGQKLLSDTHPETGEGTQHHISARKGYVGTYVSLAGDPNRIPKIAALWDSAHEVSSHREYRIITGH